MVWVFYHSRCDALEPENRSYKAATGGGDCNLKTLKPISGLFEFLTMNKRPRTSTDKAVVDVWQREVGELSGRNFAHRLGGSQDLVLRLDIHRKLAKHRGCVNTVSFNGDGDILVSGSDDRRVILWDWETGNIKLSFHSGHVNNVFQAKLMPHSNDRSIVTCAADGQVRHTQILERGGVETKLLAKHQGRAHKLAIEPGSPHIFYTCGEDGLVQHFDLRTGAATELFTCQPINDRRNYMPVIHLNAIAIDPRNPNLFAVAGSDEYTRLYDIRKYKWDGSSDFGEPANFFCPPHLIDDENVGITGLAFSEQSELLVSYNDEFIYLFTRDMGLGANPVPGSPVSMNSDASEMGGDNRSAASPSNMDADEQFTPQVYKGHRNRETVKGVNFFGPKCEYVVSGSDCGRIFIWNKKGGKLIRVMEADKRVVNCIESHPHTMVLASSGIDSDIKMWTPKALEKATLPKNIEQRVLIFDQIHWFTIGHGDYDDDDDDGDEDDDYYDDDDSDDENDDDDCDYEYDYGGDDVDDDNNGNDDDFGGDCNDPIDDNFVRRSSPERNGENSAANRELLELILTFNANSDASDDSDAGDTASQDDLFS
ncbi:hypothetical protein L6164_004719 [Bauhinia variegata]|uniref:Uncharacterized protein n=1 Tax=Bauhinia variegata TaxID=167791 RepID=A0ACB9PNF1_BAUVA|nr:hypothetical protein L6164_004719 [Bauhinia variegata]